MKLIVLLQPQKNLSPNMEAKESSKKFSLLTTVSLVRRLFLGFHIRPDTLIIRPYYIGWLNLIMKESCVFDIANMNGFPFPFQN